MTNSVAPPKLSVLLPVYNAQAHLELALTSILNQSFKDFEIIAINDGSTDASGDILDRHAKNDPRLRVFHKTNAGLIQTLNFGLEQCRAQLIARHDADDISELSRFEKQILFLAQNPDHILVASYMRYLIHNRPEGPLVVAPAYHEQIVDHLMSANCIPHGSVMFRKDFVLKVGAYGGKAEALHVEDYDLWTRLALHGKLAIIPEALYFYRDHQENISQSNSELQIRHAAILTKTLVQNSGWFDTCQSLPSYDQRQLDATPPSLSPLLTAEYKLRLLHNLLRTALIMKKQKQWLKMLHRFKLAFFLAPMGFLRWLRG